MSLSNLQVKKNIFKNYKKWLLDPTQSFHEICAKTYNPLNYFISISEKIGRLSKENEIKGNINLIMQYYIDKDTNRQREIQQTLYLNVHNNSIDKIYLFNEREYTTEELGVNSPKIIQININHRLLFEDIFNLIEQHKIEGFIVIANSDIFFDRSLQRLRECDLLNKNVLALCRYEYKGTGKLSECELFEEGRPDSQDVWIFHSEHNIQARYRSIFNFNMGKPGCDNKLIYLFQILGYHCYNEPTIIRTYHNHNVTVRNYDVKVKIPDPYVAIYPILNENDKPHEIQSFNIFLENDNLYNYIINKIEKNQHFIIPRIAGIENKLAHYGIMLKQKMAKNDISSLEQILKIMKNNAGINITSLKSLVEYSMRYLEAFHQSEMYFDWEPWGNVARHIIDSIHFIHSNFNKKRCWAFSLDIFNSIQTNPWTLSLKNKRILIISSFVKSINEKIHIREKIYGIDLFPGCEFIFLKPPLTQGNNSSQEYDIELNEFVAKINLIKDSFDIALVSCGGYGNLVCSEIYKMNKSAIYVGGVLQMYFGIYGSRWERERPEIMQLYKNEHWSKPKEEERPSGYQNVEGSCYW
jgi:hypothetical protein